MTDPFVVIGGDAAGLSAASKLRREDPDREAVVLERGRWVSYAHCGVPYFIEGAVERLSDLLSLSPADIEERGIDLRRRTEAVAVDTDARTVTVRGPDGESSLAYGDLLVATGATAVTDPIPGAGLDGAFTIHGLDSAANVRAALTDPDEFDVDALGGGGFVDREAAEHYGAMTPPETVAVVGGGYVGVEMCEAFGAWGLDVHLFQRPELPLTPFGEAVGSAVADHLRERGVELHLGTEVEGLTDDASGRADGDGDRDGDTHDVDARDGTAREPGGSDTAGRVEGVVCANGTVVPVDLAVVGVGVRPNVGLVEDTPVELGASGAIAVDERGRTSVDRVYAAGDCAEDRHVVTGEPAYVPLGLTANRAGRAVGATVGGDPTPVGGVAGTAVVKAFDLECGRTGLATPEEAREHGFDPVAETVTAGSRSGYYPGAAETTVTLVADRESERLLGGSVVGTDRAAVRIDTVATALEGGLTVPEVERLDLAYAPPFSPVWDPVLVAAKVLNGSLEE